MSKFSEGDRVQVNDASPWPERVGAVGTVVELDPDGIPRPVDGFTYVMLDDDPAQAASDADVKRRGWSDAWPDDALDPA